MLYEGCQSQSNITTDNQSASPSWCQAPIWDLIAGGVSSVFASFVSHRSSAFFRVMRLIDFETQLTFFLHSGSLVSCHNFLILFLYFNSRSRPGISLFNSDKVILLL
jgi:hypothetical protein